MPKKELSERSAAMAEQFDENGRAVAELVFSGRKLKVVYQKEISAEGKETGNCERLIQGHGKVWEQGMIPKEELLSWNEDELHEIVVSLK